jgi:hypothetical protein
MFKLASTAFTLFVVAAASQASVRALNYSDYYEISSGEFQSCPNSGEFYQGIELYAGVALAFCTPYPGPPLNASAVASVSAAAVADPGLNGWNCYPQGTAECPPGYAISELCLTSWDSAVNPAPECSNYCTDPAYFAMKCTPAPVALVPLNSGEWLTTGPDYNNAICNDGSVMCGLCTSNNPSDCQGENTRAKCCKYHNCHWSDGLSIGFPCSPSISPSVAVLFSLYPNRLPQSQ